MDKFAAMRVFVRIADAGNLSAASRQLGLSLTSVSRQLMALEGFLGTTLVERTTRHLSLTESGLLYYEWAKQILEEVAETERGLTAQRGVASRRGRYRCCPSHGTAGRLRPNCPQARRHPACCLRRAGLSAPARRAGDAGRPGRAGLPGLRRCTGRGGMELPRRRSAKITAHSNPALRQ